jgi:hypothetical protein
MKLYFLMSLINLGGLFALCIGILFTIPLSNLMFAVTYLSLTGQASGVEKVRPEFWDEEFMEPV